MNLGQAILFDGWEIVPFVMPTPDGRWSGSFKITKAGLDTPSPFKGLIGSFLRETREAAFAAACENAKLLIKEKSGKILDTESLDG